MVSTKKCLDISGEDTKVEEILGSLIECDVAVMMIPEDLIECDAAAMLVLEVLIEGVAVMVLEVCQATSVHGKLRQECLHEDHH